MNQEKALALLKSGRNIFLTGSAGSGKTYILNQYIQYLQERKIKVAVTASTGIAATHMNGMTIHSWAGIGVKEQMSHSQIAQLKTKKYLSKHLEEVQVLILDEISMLHQRQLELVNQVLCEFKGNYTPFGGIQVLFCGDFFQLPPIGNPGEKSRDKFAFMAPSWVQAELNVCYLTEQFRQSDSELNAVLNEIRNGEVSESSINALKKASQVELDYDFEPTKLYTHNFDVDAINKQELAKISGKTRKFKASGKGNDKLVEGLKNTILAPSELQLKIGAKVMFVKNNVEKGYVNGSLGVVLGFNDKGFPSVKLNGGHALSVEAENWSIIDESGKSLASVTQVPLRLAWAITVHKSQGMTLEAAEIDLSKTFESGQGYVALSRLKSLSSLKLLGFNARSLSIDPLAFKADKRFRELSEELEQKTTTSDLNKEALAFIRNCDGLTDPHEVKKQKAKIQEKRSKGKLGKSSTYDISLTYLKQNIPLKEIAEKRGMTTGTIAGHFLKLKQENPEHNFSYYKPKSSIIKKVESAYAKQKNQDQVSLKAIHEQLKGSISYDNIKLALAFIS